MVRQLDSLYFMIRHVYEMHENNQQKGQEIAWDPLILSYEFVLNTVGTSKPLGSKGIKFETANVFATLSGTYAMQK